MKKIFYILSFLLLINIGCSDNKKEEEVPVNTTLVGNWDLRKTDENDNVTENIKVKFDDDGLGEWTNHKPALFSHNPQPDVTYKFYYSLKDSILTVTASDSTWVETYDIDYVDGGNMLFIHDSDMYNSYILYRNK